MKKPSIVQLNNHYINEENIKKRFEEEEIQKRNRFMGWILVSMMFLFILPTYNLVKGYVSLKKQGQQIITLEKEYRELEKKTKSEKQLAEQLKNDDFVKKYARAKYYLSREGEVIYPTPGLLPK
ncbi:TPA: septum formation initiator family protein [Streptococcus equi subsp. zooepidemicus]|uniref:Septum formation initiator protein n=8 Tax=Streptococcus equi TaxID=1336 RepID=A0A2X3S2E1_STRSZ|nr:septum formation initiator family protein [Streptococcus equi]KIS11016.1 septum formation initiator protein [Streptococcus equi subsp. zooepidemicus Sz105]KIS15840.1 septum formation initiator protein [Streptococcus equi subsp. zooepidemicus Sz4is]ASB95670.1 septum formation initiation protein [Streptococcus equi subsp. equi]EQB22900.1 septum formation initiator protein [Streptococcus equi subsp. zooepidemicus SzS31A1]KED04929.1 septum formation initiator protein [Streptococcus equi subsp. 